MRRISKGLTLVELLTALILLSIIVLGLTNIDFFSLFHVLSSDRRAKIQNEASLALEHMSKENVRAIGNEILNGANSVVAIVNNPTDASIMIYIDASGNGQREAPIVNPLPSNDHWIAYRYDSTGAPSNRNEIRYCGRCRDSTCDFSQCLDTVEVISNKITAFTPSKPVNASNQLNNNYVTIQIQACWDPSETMYRCNTPDNPSVEMKASIRMPAVSTN